VTRGADQDPGLGGGVPAPKSDDGGEVDLGAEIKGGDPVVEIVRGGEGGVGVLVGVGVEAGGSQGNVRDQEETPLGTN